MPAPGSPAVWSRDSRSRMPPGDRRRTRSVEDTEGRGVSAFAAPRMRQLAFHESLALVPIRARSGRDDQFPCSGSLWPSTPPATSPANSRHLRIRALYAVGDAAGLSGAFCRVRPCGLVGAASYRAPGETYRAWTRNGIDSEFVPSWRGPARYYTVRLRLPMRYFNEWVSMVLNSSSA